MEILEMNLDDPKSFQSAAQAKLLSDIERLPDALLEGFAAGNVLALDPIDGPKNIVMAGTGNSIIGADLLAAYVSSLCPIPVSIHRDYGLPAFAGGPHTLVILCCYSGETQETLSSLEAAVKSGCRILAVCTGGKLAEEASKEASKSAGLVWQIESKYSAHAAIGFSFGLLLAAFQRLGLVTDQDLILDEAVTALKTQQAALGVESPVSRNPAKRVAGQLMGRLVTVFAAGQLVPVARHWKTQINQLAKSIAQFESLPEADYGALQGASMPEAILLHSMALFLRAPSDRRQNRLRSNLTRRVLMLEGVNTDFIDARGDTPLAHIWTLTHMGDYIAFYLAAAYGIDPTPMPAPENPKNIK
jgi:glucose/mannose-6-phosphate isomerase